MAATAPDPPRGNLLALASGVTYALMLAGLRWQARHGHEDSGVATAILGNVIAFAAALPMALPVTRFTGADVAVILYLGAAQIGLAYWCLTRAIRYVPAFEATTMLQIEPAMNPIWSWMAHGERPTPLGTGGRRGNRVRHRGEYVVGTAAEYREFSSPSRDLAYAAMGHRAPHL